MAESCSDESSEVSWQRKDGILGDVWTQVSSKPSPHLLGAPASHRVLPALFQRSEVCSSLCIPPPPSNLFFQLQPVISRLKPGHVSPWCEILVRFPTALRVSITLFFRALKPYTICLCPPAPPALPLFFLPHRTACGILVPQ